MEKYFCSGCNYRSSTSHLSNIHAAHKIFQRKKPGSFRNAPDFNQQKYKLQFIKQQWHLPRVNNLSATKWNDSGIVHHVVLPDIPSNVNLTHWGRVTHICASELTTIGSDKGLLPHRRQAIIWTNAGILLIRPLETNFSEILIEI